MKDISVGSRAVNIKEMIFSKWLILTFSAIGTALTLGAVLRYSNYGIDFTDESSYLVWISNPFNYTASATQFGFIYHPVYELVNGNIAALRQGNILITFALACVLANVFLKVVFGSHSLERAPRLVISGAISTATAGSLILAGLWFPTPSYNSLALQALLVAAVGLVLTEKHYSRVSVVGWFLIGVGGWLAFMAKPTTAAALGLCTFFYLLLAGKFNIRWAVISVAAAVGLIVISAFAIDGSIIGFIDRLRDGAEMAKTLSNGHTFAHSLRLDEFQLGEREGFFLKASAAVFFLAAYFSQSKNENLEHIGILLSIVFALASMAILLRFSKATLNVGQFQGLLIWSIPCAAILAGFSIYRLKGLFKISRSQWALALIFAVFPYIYVFGTDNNYWILSAHAGIFWILAGLVFLGPVSSSQKFPTLLISLGLAIQFLGAVLIQSSVETPYRQPQPLLANDYKFEMGEPGSTLVLSEGFGRYFAAAIDVAKKAGFKKGMPMIDLSGRSPGILYALSASSIGQAWTIGGYPRSNERAVTMLRKVPCRDLAAAWLLEEADGPRKISPEILSSFGANIATDYENVGSFQTAIGAGGYKKARVQTLLKPIRSINVAMAGCATRRISKQ